MKEEMFQHKCHADLNQTVIQMREIVKKFGDFTAVDHVSITVHKGEVHAILGENGAGKSTLMNMLYGMYMPTEGEIEINGETIVFDNPKKAIEHGIGMVHQHFMLIQPFTVTENIILGMEPKKGIVVDSKLARNKIIALSEKYNMMVDPDARIEDISVGMQQRVEILKVLYRGADILIFDEPTASLTPQEITELMMIIDNLTHDGKTVLMITHKLREIKACADYCTIIRQGQFIQTMEVNKVSENELAAMMVGRKVEFAVDKKKSLAGEIVLSIKDLHAKDYRGVEILKGLNLRMRRGQIVGLAGVDGNGQSELVEILTGIRKAESGDVRVNCKTIFNVTPEEIFRKGVTSIPADRQKHGLIMDFTVAENLILQKFHKEPYAKKGILQPTEIQKHAKELIEKYDVRPRECEDKKAEHLSGGNQQKVVIAREVSNDSDLLIAMNPTRGLDVGAIEFVHKYLIEQRDKKKAVLLVSFDLDEIMSLSDRIDVIYDGQIVGSTPNEDVDEEILGLLMAGGTING